jgi:hypothetical protein
MDIHAVHNRQPKGSAALDDPPTHGPRKGVRVRLTLPVRGCALGAPHTQVDALVGAATAAIAASS